MAILNFNNTVIPYDAEVWSQKINGRLNGLKNSEIPIAQQVKNIYQFQTSYQITAYLKLNMVATKKECVDLCYSPFSWLLGSPV